MPFIGEIPNPLSANIVNTNTLSAAGFNAGAAYVDIFGSMGTYQRTILVGQTTETLSDANIWTISQTNGSTITDGTQIFNVNSGTNAAGTASLESVQRARFFPGAINLWASALFFSNNTLPPNNSLLQVGPYTTQDGIALSWLNGGLRIITRIAGVATVIPQASFNGSPLLLSDYIFGAQWSILYGVGGALIYVGPKLIHTIIGTYTSKLNLPLRAEIQNTGNTTAFSLFIEGWAIQNLGATHDTQELTAFIDTATTTVVKHGHGTLTSICIGSGTQSGVLTLYDNTAASGTILQRITWQANVAPMQFRLRQVFSTGLTAVTTTASGIAISLV